ncbi:MAG: MoaD/ThiS family protein [Chloroflexota bacterium]|nr:MAG: MoaD/ThiS family protein [Chloroflexota bacterium]
MIRVKLPYHLQTMARTGAEVKIEVPADATQRTLLDTLEAEYPVLRGTIRDHATQERRAYLRFFACEQDLSHESPDAPLPVEVIQGEKPFLIVGAIAGG